MKHFRPPAFSAVADWQWRSLQALIAVPGKVMPHEVVTQSGMDRVTVVAIFTALAQAGCGRLLLLVYWSQAGEQPVAARAVQDGFPRLPMYVDAADDYVEDPDELTYDYMLQVDEGVSLER